MEGMKGVGGRWRRGRELVGGGVKRGRERWKGKCEAGGGRPENEGKKKWGKWKERVKRR